MKRQSGFTLIELVMVIVILGILAAAAMPKFVNLKTDAETATLAGIAGSLKSAVSINYVARSLHPASGVTTAGAGCGTVFNTLLEGGLPEPYLTQTNAINTNILAGATKQCLLTADGVTSMVIPVLGMN